MLKKCLWGIASTTLLALYLFALYELLLVPAILDWSLYGVGLALAMVGLLIWCLPADRRLSNVVLSLTFLLALQAIDNIREYPLLTYFFVTLLIFIVLLVVGKLLGHFSLRRYLVVFLAALVLTSALDLSEVPFWTEFRVKWESPLLYKKFATVDFFPTRLIDVDRDNIKEIVTQENLDQAAKELHKFDKGKKYQILEPEENHFAVYKWNGNTFVEITPGRYNLSKLELSLPVDYLGYPFYTISRNIDKDKGLVEQMNPLLDRARLVEQAARFGSSPFEMLAMGQKSLESRIMGPAVPTTLSQSTASGHFLPGPTTETVTIDNNLKVQSADPEGKTLGVLASDKVPDIGTSEITVGDVDSDKTDELLLTSETSRILKLSGDGNWRVLWSSSESLGDKARFQKFRFEDFASLGSDPKPQLIALSKSNVRANSTRYMTGYVYRDGVLEQKWRVFSGLINLRAGDVDGDGKNELIGYMYRSQRVFVLEKHNFPVVPTLYGITGGLILLGFALQWRQKRQTVGGGEQNV
ncbi:MAG: hypothetical protein ACYC21_15705 [Eubacteriales bacterium]